MVRKATSLVHENPTTILEYYERNSSANSAPQDGCYSTIDELVLRENDPIIQRPKNAHACVERTQKRPSDVEAAVESSDHGVVTDSETVLALLDDESTLLRPHQKFFAKVSSTARALWDRSESYIGLGNSMQPYHLQATMSRHLREGEVAPKAAKPELSTELGNTPLDFKRPLDSNDIYHYGKGLFVGKLHEMPPPKPAVNLWERDIKDRLLTDLHTVSMSVIRSIQEEDNFIEAELLMTGQVSAGDTHVSLHPTICICCGSKKYRKAIRAAIEDLSYVRSFEGGTQVTVRGPVLASSETLNAKVLADAEAKYRECRVEELVDRGSACGLRLIAKHEGIVSTVSTIGGTVHVGGALWGLTTAHGLCRSMATVSSSSCPSTNPTESYAVHQKFSKSNELSVFDQLSDLASDSDDSSISDIPFIPSMPSISDNPSDSGESSVSDQFSDQASDSDESSVGESLVKFKERPSKIPDEKIISDPNPLRFDHEVDKQDLFSNLGPMAFAGAGDHEVKQGVSNETLPQSADFALVALTFQVAWHNSYWDPSSRSVTTITGSASESDMVEKPIKLLLSAEVVQTCYLLRGSCTLLRAGAKMQTRKIQLTGPIRTSVPSVPGNKGVSANTRYS